MAFVEPHSETFYKPFHEHPNILTRSSIAQLEPDGIPTVPDNLPTVPDSYLDPPQGVAPIGGLSAELAELQSRLANMQALPLFLPKDRGELISASTRLSDTQLSEPSFAWIEDQLNERYGPNKRGQNEAAITQWSTYRTNDGLRYVDVIIDAGLWSQFTYFDRYAFVRQFGSAAIVEGYQLRVFHTEDVDNYIEALALEENGRDPSIVRPVFLRGSYFCKELSSESAEPYICELIVSR
ncbi:hypothetical protein [Synechococcus sp. PCC 7335]|uniref:hypothetical protein n=1 Tax=Synechococcus sp. (strain ATCC 29403 / PCC 7335) TaxID=91464 RepID=UPI0012F7CE5E|nr:hypothetical protein [Synechococcus sp. PCC 7335]